MGRVLTGRLFLLCFCVAAFQETAALKCYKCSFFSKPNYKDCATPDADTAIEECEGDDVCTAVGYNYVRDDNYTEYSNIRRCGESNLCLGAWYAYGEDNLRNCHVCNTDLCNAGPLVPGATGSGSLREEVAGNKPEDEASKPEAKEKKPEAKEKEPDAKGSKPEAPKVKAEGNVAVNGGVKG